MWKDSASVDGSGGARERLEWWRAKMLTQHSGRYGFYTQCSLKSNLILTITIFLVGLNN